MGSYDQRGFLRDHFDPDGFFPEHALAMSMPEVSSGLSISLPTTMSCQLGSPLYSNSFCTPRTIAPHPGYMLAPPTHGYHSEEAYTITGHSASARGRSCSGASTVSADYSVGSQEATPRSPYSFIEPSSQYRGPEDNQVNYNGGPAFHSQGTSSLIQEKKELVAKQEADGIRSSSGKSIADNQSYCPHKDCMGEDGRPKKFFSRKADVTRHYKSRHDIKYIDCPKRNCERKGSQGFTRRDHMTEHLRGFHMEVIPKIRHNNTKAKRGVKQTSENGNGSNSSSEDLTPTEQGDEIFCFSSEKQGFAEHTDHGIKHESLHSSDEEVENIFPVYEDILPKRSKQFKKVAQRRKSKVIASPDHPTLARHSNIPSQHSPTGGIAQPNPYRLGVKTESASSLMMHELPTYTTHHQHQHQDYTTSSSMMAPLYAADSGVGSFFWPSTTAQAHENLPTQTIARYQVETLDSSHLCKSEPYTGV
ncbi:uncharacterized protein PV07_07941 [Cladophialophora immunda]|uniref:C2H2-type domain-containing protein n=1 Tax=Cladophialophora immunda TaxID=569365 RepID=A0A0D2ASW7_9EURO|nr:uncharacterized protein PV07_07941 [Cladophialophora immunda]KIW28262.1 hypothetical protein PV07_07941 [Cladophialophora immunda]OQV08009.1 hypothetical protein CLAIMM_12347 [Cladophialophora immunda]